jgi:intraflagellar transport protein 88
MTSQKSPEEHIKAMEKKIIKLIDDSIKQVEAGNPQMALEMAKEAGARERKLTRFREQTLQSNPEAKILALNLDIMFLVLMNLAECFLECKMYQEALNTYSAIAKNKMFHQAGRMRVNMGNIYMEQGKYHQALKMYRMALDQIPNSNKSLR